MSSKPIVSVVMPEYNGAEYVGEAIESILQQTLTEFELIIVDDLSTDKTVEVIQTFNDRRIKLFVNSVNLGRAGSDNAALPYVKGKYLAKMDSDDICFPNRLEKQAAFLENNPHINVVGSWMQNFGASTYLNKYPEAPALAKCTILFGLPVGNPSVMLRSSLFQEKGMHYDASLRQTEDFDFFARYVNDLVVSTLPETLIKYRNYPESVKKDILVERGDVSHKVRENMLKTWGIPFTSTEASIHNAIAHSNLDLAPTVDFTAYQEWLLKIYNFNKVNPFFDDVTLLQLLAEKWFYVCYFNSGKKVNLYTAYNRSVLKKHYTPSLSVKIKFLIRGILNF